MSDFSYSYGLDTREAETALLTLQKKVDAMLGHLRKISLSVDTSQVNKAVGDVGSKLKKIPAPKIPIGVDSVKATENVQKFIRESSGKFSKSPLTLPVNVDTADASQKLGKLFQFNNVTQAVSTLQSSLTGLTKPFIELDTATANLRTLGDEAAGMAPSLREAAITMSKDLPFAAAEIQTTMFDALASGVKGGEAGLKTFADTAAKLATGGAATIGDATKLLAGTLNAYGESADSAGKYSDLFFNIVNAGVTSIPELNASMSNVVPTAASLGVGLDSVGGALADMTAKGIPTAQSTTKLNQLLLELAKPGAKLAPILKKAGVSLESLKQDDLPVTLEKVNKALKETGTTAISAFSSSEAAAAFNTLGGDIQAFKDAFEAVKNPIGSAQNAFEQMSQSVEVQTKQMQSQLDAFTIEAIDSLGAVGPAAVVASNAFAQLSPQISAMAGIKAIIPDGAVKGMFEFAKGILSRIIPTLGAQTVAQGTVTASAATMWGTALAPITAVVAGVAAVIGVTKLLSDALHDTAEEKLEEVNSEKQLLDTQVKSNQERQQQIRGAQKLQDEYIALGQKTKRTAEEEKRMCDVALELNKTYPGVIDSTKSFSDNLQSMSKQAGLSTEELGKLENQMTALEKKAREISQKQVGLQRDIAKENIENILTDAKGNIIDSAEEFVVGTSTARSNAENFVKQYSKAIYNAKSIDEVAQASQAFKEAILRDSKLSNADKNKALNAVNDFAQKQADIINGASEKKAEEVKSDPAKAPAVAEAKDISAELLKIERETAAIRGEIKVKSIENEKQREIEAAKLASKSAIDSVRDEIRQTNKDKDLSAGQKSALASKNNEKIKALTEKLESDKLAIEGKYQKKSFDDALAKVKEQQDAEIALVSTHIQNLEALEQSRALTNDELEAIGKSRLKLISDQADAEVKSYIEGTQEFKEFREKLDAEFALGKLDANEAAARFKKFREDFANKAVTGRDPVLEELRAIEEKNLLKTAEQERKNREALRLNKINEEENDAKRERELRIFEAQKTLDEELRLAGANNSKKVAATRKFNQQLITIQQQFLRDSSKVSDNALIYTQDLFNSIAAEFGNATQSILDEQKSKIQSQISDINNFRKNGGKQALETELNNLKKQEDDLLKSLTKRQITQEEYSAKLTEIQQQRSDKEKEFADKNVGFWAESWLKIRLAVTSSMQAASETARSKFDEMTKGVEDTSKISTEAWQQLAVASGAMFTSLIASGKNGFQSLVLVALDALDALVPVISAQIAAWSLAQPDSVISFGSSATIRTGIITAILKTIVAGAKVAAGFKDGVVGWDGTGGIKIGGGRDNFLARLEKGETVFSKIHTMKNRELFEHIRKGMPAEEFLYKKFRPAIVAQTHDILKHYLGKQNKSVNIQAAIQQATSENRDVVSEIRQLRKVQEAHSGILERIAKREQSLNHDVQEVVVTVKDKSTNGIKWGKI